MAQSFGVHSLLFPLSLCITVFGFPAAEFGSSVASKLQRVYCVIISVSMFVLRTMSLVIELYNVNVTFIYFMFTISESAAIITLTYYSIMFFKAGDINRRISSSLDDVDKCLDSIGVKVSHVKEHTVCFVSVTLTITTRAFEMYLFLSNMASNNVQQTLAMELRTTVRFFVNFVTYYSMMALELYLYVILYVLMRRAAIFHNTILTLNCLRLSLIHI